MIVGFSVKNFLSFHEEQTFSFLTPSHAGKTKVANPTPVAPSRISRTAIIFGPNASGKSNLILALKTMRDLVVHSSNYSGQQFSNRYTPFLLDASSSKPTTFRMDAIVEGRRYFYEFSYDSKRIVAERLLLQNGKSWHQLFDRRFDRRSNATRWVPFGAELTGVKQVWKAATRDTALFLTTAVRLNSKQLKPLCDWFEVQLNIRVSSESGDMVSLAAHLEDESFKSRILSILRAVDLPVSDIRVVREDMRGFEMRRDTSNGRTKLGEPKIELLHSLPDQPPVWFKLEAESSGVRQFLALLGPVISAVDEGRLAAIDEFDSGLHPLVAKFLISLVNDPRLSKRTTQLLVSSHDSSLMKALAPSDLWLMQLNPKRASTLSRLRGTTSEGTDHNQDDYLRGEYGGVPVIAAGALAALRPSDDTETIERVDRTVEAGANLDVVKRPDRIR